MTVPVLGMSLSLVASICFVTVCHKGALCFTDIRGVLFLKTAVCIAVADAIDLISAQNILLTMSRLPVIPSAGKRLMVYK